jgi:acyl-CoA oxidase
MTGAGMWAYDPSVIIKFGVHMQLYGKTLMNLGTEKHLPFLERAKKFDDIGSFALTELGHGSNVRSIITTAIFDRTRGCFILNTPHDMGIKFWIGATANLANVSAVFA